MFLSGYNIGGGGGGRGDRGPEPERIGGGRQEIKVPEAGEQGTGCWSF